MPHKPALCELSHLLLFKTNDSNEFTLLERAEYETTIPCGKTLSDDFCGRLELLFVARREGGRRFLQAVQPKLLECRSIARSENSNLHGRPNV